MGHGRDGLLLFHSVGASAGRLRGGGLTQHLGAGII